VQGPEGCRDLPSLGETSEESSNYEDEEGDNREAGDQAAVKG